MNLSNSPAIRCVLKTMLYPLFARYLAMPGESHRGMLPALTELDETIAANSRRLVTHMADEIGERSIAVPQGLADCADFIESEFRALGYEVWRQPFQYRGITMYNLVAELKGSDWPDEILVLGAHYDTVIGTPGADDNASGVAALLELARLLKSMNVRRTVRFVAFANEENNGDGPENMGSYHYATHCHREGDRMIGMLSLEMLGCFSDAEGSQKYPFPFNLFYPTKGNFIGFVGNYASREFVRDVIGRFRRQGSFPSQGVAAPERFRDIARSDHWSFWQYDVPALMVTDTSNFRYQHVHEQDDTPDKVDFDSMARVVSGILHVVSGLAG